MDECLDKLIFDYSEAKDDVEEQELAYERAVREGEELDDIRIELREAQSKLRWVCFRTVRTRCFKCSWHIESKKQACFVCHAPGHIKQGVPPACVTVWGELLDVLDKRKGCTWQNPAV